VWTAAHVAPPSVGQSFAALPLPLPEPVEALDDVVLDVPEVLDDEDAPLVAGSLGADEALAVELSFLRLSVR
jgi:hypothetical protein